MLCFELGKSVKVYLLRDKHKVVNNSKYYTVDKSQENQVC